MTRSGGAGRAKPPAARAKPPKTKTQTTNEGRWTDEEHRKFLEAYDTMIAVDPARRRWPNVAAAVGTRSTTQCRSHALCGNQNLRRVRADFFASTSTSSTQRLLDSVAVPVPHRSTEPGRPHHRREMT